MTINATNGQNFNVDTCPSTQNPSNYPIKNRNLFNFVTTVAVVPQTAPTLPMKLLIQSLAILIIAVKITFQQSLYHQKRVHQKDNYGPNASSPNHNHATAKSSKILILYFFLQITIPKQMQQLNYH